MDLNINLLKRENKRLSTIRIIGGIVYLLCSGSYLFDAIGNESSKTFEWISFGVFLLGGLFFLTEGFGYSLGKAYVLINSERISFKARVYNKGQSARWNEIESISYKFHANKFEIKKTDQTNMILNLSEFEYATVRKIKEAMDYYAKEKNVPIKILKSD